jgi:hypothetical protein
MFKVPAQWYCCWYNCKVRRFESTKTRNLFWHNMMSKPSLKRLRGIYQILWSSSIFQKLMLSSIWQKIGVVFYSSKYILVVFNFPKYSGLLPFAQILRLSPISHNIEVIFHLPKYGGHLPFAKYWGLSCICQIIEVVFHLPKYWGRLPFVKILRSSSICQNIEVVLYLPKY